MAQTRSRFRTWAWLFVPALAILVAAALQWRARAAGPGLDDMVPQHLDPPDLASEAYFDPGPGIRVLCYHYFRHRWDTKYFAKAMGAVVLGLPTLGPREFWTTPIEEFERHLRLFRDHQIPVLTLDEIAARQAAGRPLPTTGVVITIDDADRSVYELAWPLMQRYGVRGHLFVPTGKAGTAWSGLDVCSWSELREMADSGVLVMGSHTHDLHYKIATRSGHQPVFWHPTAIADTQIDAERQQLRELTGETVGDLPFTTRLDAVALDLRLSRTVIERHLRQAPVYLAWPYGFGDGRLDSLAAAVGFSGTLSLHPRPIRSDGGHWHIGRYTLTAKTTLDQMSELVTAGAGPS